MEQNGNNERAVRSRVMRYLTSATSRRMDGDIEALR